MKTTGFQVMNGHDEEIEADADGSNLAFCCDACGHPVLATALKAHRGSDESHPAKCNGCGLRYFLDIRIEEGKLYVQTL